MSLSPEESFAEDILRGTRAIASYTGESERRTHYLLERGLLPAFKIGNLWHMRKSTHRVHIQKLETAQMNAA